jgi:macrolide-specific efflux system membrane fusion protein
VGIVRRWVFPIIWVVIFAVIASALVKLAFFPDSSASGAADVPSAEIVEPHYEVIRGTISNNVTLSGTVEADAAVAVPATLTGEVRELYVGAGQWVDAGAAILEMRAVVANPDGTSGTQWKTVTAPVSGILSSFTALVGQQFSVGDPVGQIAPPSFLVSGSIPPEQLYRLIDRPADAQVAINGGPAPFTCTGLTITTPLQGAGSGGTGTSGGQALSGSGGPTVRCAVPAEVTVFAGLVAEIVIVGGIADNVLVVPTTAVEGVAGTGNVYLVLPDGSTEVRTVSLGLNDGLNVEVTEGLEEGDVILQFVPGAPGADTQLMGENCVPDGNGGVICTG